MKNFIKRVVLAGALLITMPLLIIAQQKGRQVEAAGNSETALINEIYTGDWKFEAPNAPEGSQKGNVVIKTNAVVMSFDEFMQFPSEWLKVRNDSIIYEVAFDDTTVRFSLKVTDANKMTGKAVWDDGETPVILTKKIIGIKI
jgi:hypothetical protein